jgi:4-amino-4-deoxy-L-arabinose transferase-like glycosyltransferase
VIFKINRHKILILFIVPLLLYVALLPFIPLLEPDEARYSNVASLMNRSGDYITPQLLHVIFIEKPPLVYWATAVAFKVFGENAFSARLFVGLCAWACVLLVYAMGVTFRDEKTGLYSAGILSTFLYIFFLGHMSIMDMPLTFFVSLAIWSGYRYFAGTNYPKKWLYLFYLSCAMAFLSKGLIGVVFPPAIIVLWLLVCKRWREVIRLLSPVGILLFLAIAGPWVMLAQHANNEFLWFFFIREHFLRYSTKMHGRDESLLYYLPIVLLGTLPWIASLITACWKNRDARKPLFRKNDLYLMFTWMIFVLGFFSFSSSKLVPYIAPLFLPLSILISHYIRRYDEAGTTSDSAAKRRFIFDIPIVIQSLLFIALLSLPFFKQTLMRTGGDFEIIQNDHLTSLLILPIFLQILIIFLPGLVKKVTGKGWFMTMYGLAALFLASLLPPASAFLTPYKTAVPVQAAIKDFVPAGQTVYQYGLHLYGINFGNPADIRTPIVDDFAELNYGISKLHPDMRNRYFLPSIEALALHVKINPVYCVTNKYRITELRQYFPKLDALWNNGYFYLVRLT